jgi:hypothetical protein
MIDGKKHTPGSNTLKKMKRKAAAEAAAKANKPAADKPKGKKVKAKEKPPIPAKRSMKDKVKVPKGPTMVGGKRGGSAAHTKGGNAGEKKSTILGVGPKAKLSTDKKKKWKNKGNGMVRQMVYE